MMPTNPKWKKHWQTPQLPSVRLGPEYAWLADALERQPEGRSGAVRVVLREVLGKAAKARLEAQHMGKSGAAATLPPTRLVAGYEDLPEVIDATRKRVAKRLGYEVDNADVIRWALWAGLEKRGEKAPPKPVDLYAEVRRNPKLLHSELAKKLGTTVKVVTRVRDEVGAVPLPEQVAIARRLNPRETAIALDESLTQTAAAKMIGVSQKTVSLHRKRAHEKQRRKSAPPKK